jgi:nuclear protein localization family protein 4
MGFLYGKVLDSKAPTLEDDKEIPKEYLDYKYYAIEIHTIYEPPQKSSDDGNIYLEIDKNEEKVEKLAESLGLIKVGWIFSHNGKRTNPLLAHEIIKAADYQIKYGEYFQTLTISKKEESNETKFEAFQVSRQCCELVKKKMMKLDNKNNENILFTKDIQIEGTKNIKKDVDCIVFIVNTPIQIFKGIFSFGFYPSNRNLTEFKQV